MGEKTRKGVAPSAWRRAGGLVSLGEAHACVRARMAKPVDTRAGPVVRVMTSCGFRCSSWTAEDPEHAQQRELMTLGCLRYAFPAVCCGFFAHVSRTRTCPWNHSIGRLAPPRVRSDIKSRDCLTGEMSNERHVRDRVIVTRSAPVSSQDQPGGYTDQHEHLRDRVDARCGCLQSLHRLAGRGKPRMRRGSGPR